MRIQFYLRCFILSVCLNIVLFGSFAFAVVFSHTFTPGRHLLSLPCDTGHTPPMTVFASFDSIFGDLSFIRWF
jgi:hypothetical protein